VLPRLRPEAAIRIEGLIVTAPSLVFRLAEMRLAKPATFARWPGGFFRYREIYPDGSRKWWLGTLRLPEGATVDEVASVTGWQCHTVRGVFSGTLEEKARAHACLGQRGAWPGLPH
jgi:hypothetical protein